MIKPETLWPADKVERRKVAALLPYARNARTHSDAQVAQIAASIREWGWTVPILVDEAGTIIAGHGRVLAAQRLGIAEVPVMVAAGWTEAQKRAYAIADNKLALNAGWDDELLKLELGDLEAGGFDLSLIGFSDDDLAGLKVEASKGLTDPDAAPEPPARPVSAEGDLWLLGRHRVLCGDSTAPAAVERLLAGVKPLLMVTDPPYGVEYDPTWRDEAGGQFGDGKTKMRGKVSNDDRVDWSEAWTLFPGDVAYVWHASLKTSEVADSLGRVGFVCRAQIIWAKQHFTLMRTGYHWQHEPCWYAVRKGGKGHWSGDRKQTTLWEIRSLNPAGGERDEVKTGHGTQKPVECMRRPIENNSSPGQAVYDPFLGSGTTIIAAEQTGRAALGLEIDPAYCDVIVRRWQDFTGEVARLDGDGRTFAEISDARYDPNVDAHDSYMEGIAAKRKELESAQAKGTA